MTGNALSSLPRTTFFILRLLKKAEVSRHCERGLRHAWQSIISPSLAVHFAFSPSIAELQTLSPPPLRRGLGGGLSY
ncbi:hypothetical protein [Helicobacter sp. T3_23-1059]